MSQDEELGQDEKEFASRPPPLPVEFSAKVLNQSGIASQGHSIQENLSNTRSIGGNVVIEESFEVLSLQLALCHEGRKFANYLILGEPNQP